MAMQTFVRQVDREIRDRMIILTDLVGAEPDPEPQDSAFMGALASHGIFVEKPEKPTSEEIIIGNIEFIQNHSIRHMGNSYVEAATCDFIDLMDAVISDIEDRKGGV